jgi:hypothetical protein
VTARVYLLALPSRSAAIQYGANNVLMVITSKLYRARVGDNEPYARTLRKLFINQPNVEGQRPDEQISFCTLKLE